jgi:hypothetical protein
MSFQGNEIKGREPVPVKQTGISALFDLDIAG